MEAALLTKYFNFSASFSRGAKVYGHNYLLGVTTAALDELSETGLESRIHQALIQKLESRDLGMHVDFLKGVEISDANLLKAFWPVIESAIRPVGLKRLTLQRDERTQTELNG